MLSTTFSRLCLQTDGCLRQLTASLAAAGRTGALQPPAVVDNANVCAAGADSPTAGASSIAALEQSNESWNQLAAAFQADDIGNQPALLTGARGGELPPGPKPCP